MPFSVLCEMTLTAALTVWSPGPNNILLLSTASKYGFKKNMKFMLGIWTGSLSLMILCGLLGSLLSSIVPEVRPIMTWVGAGYLFYLAWKTYRRLPPGEEDTQKEPSYVMGIFLQLINVKIIIYGLTMFSSFILPYEQRPLFLLFYAFYLMVMGAIGNLIWAFAGNVLQKFYKERYKLVNVIMALLLVWCALRVIGVL
ncbi:MAG: LysE family transporter [Eubacteriales bacterium]|nr:LysE family transporter [Eubacteriales bacterium]